MKKTTILTITLALCLAFIMLAGGCSGGAVLRGERKCIDGCRKPGWIGNTDREYDKETKAFIGISKVFSMEQRARSDAEKDAFKKSADNLGVFVKNKLNEVISSSGSSADIINPAVVSDEIAKLKSGGMTAGEFSEYYTERWVENNDGNADYYYKVYALYKVKKETIRKFMTGVINRRKEEEESEKLRRDLDRALAILENMSDTDL